MKAEQIHPGDLMKYESKVCRVTDKEMHGHGKVSPTVHVKLKELETGHCHEQTFRPSDAVEKLDAETVEMEYSYAEDNFFVFMNSTTYEQMRLNKESIGEKSAYLQEGGKIKVLIVEGTPMTVDFPETMTFKVTTSMDGLKNVDKEVELENGLKVLVPHFVNEGDHVVVKTEDGSYLERVTTKSLSSGGDHHNQKEES